MSDEPAIFCPLCGTETPYDAEGLVRHFWGWHLKLELYWAWCWCGEGFRHEDFFGFRVHCDRDGGVVAHWLKHHLG